MARPIKSEISKAWYAVMMERYNTDEEGVRAIMRERQAKGMKNPNRQKGKHKGGFKNNPELARMMQRKGVEARRRKRENKLQADV